MKADFERAKREVARDRVVLGLIMLASVIMVPIAILVAISLVSNWQHNPAPVLIIAWVLTVPFALWAMVKGDQVSYRAPAFRAFASISEYLDIWILKLLYLVSRRRKLAPRTRALDIRFLYYLHRHIRQLSYRARVLAFKYEYLSTDVQEAHPTDMRGMALFPCTEYGGYIVRRYSKSILLQGKSQEVDLMGTKLKFEAIHPDRLRMTVETVPKPIWFINGQHLEQGNSIELGYAPSAGLRIGDDLYGLTDFLWEYRHVSHAHNIQPVVEIP